MSNHQVSLHESVVGGTKHLWVKLDMEIVASMVELEAGGVEVQPISSLYGFPYRAASLEEAVRQIALRGRANTEQVLTGASRGYYLKRAETCYASTMPLTADELTFLATIAAVLRTNEPVEGKGLAQLRSLFGRHCKHSAKTQEDPCSL